MQPLSGSIAINYQLMRDLDVRILTETTARLLVEANYRIPPDFSPAARASSRGVGARTAESAEPLTRKLLVRRSRTAPVFMQRTHRLLLEIAGCAWTAGTAEAIFEDSRGTSKAISWSWGRPVRSAIRVAPARRCIH